MLNYQPALANHPTAAHAQTIIEKAVTILNTIGIACGHEHTIKLLQEKYPGTEHVDGRLKFSPATVTDFIASNKANDDPAPPPFTLGKSWMALNYCDPLTQEIRPATSDEAAQMARLWDARGVRWCIPLTPCDVNPALITLAGERIALKNSSTLGGFLSVMDPEEIRYLIDMFKAAGRTYMLDEQVGLSPLRFNDHGLESALRFMDNPDIEVVLSGSIPMAGATCALDPFTAAVQSTAESIAADMLAGAYGVNGGGLMRIESFDFKHSGIVWGSPEWCLYIDYMAGAHKAYKGTTRPYGSFRTNARQPDAQAQTERTASCLWQALLGARIFSGVGQLCIDEVFSPQQVIFDQEILDYVQRLVSGFETDETVDPEKTINEGIMSGTFMATEDTVTRFRDFFHDPDLYTHVNLGRWQADGGKTLLAEAWEKAQGIIAQSDFRLPESQEKEVDRIYEKAVAYVLNK